MNHRHFVIQKHIQPDSTHWDFMLETGDCLWTWRIFTAPDKIASQTVAAEKITNHPKRFLTYEGPVQNNTANVRIADSGSYSMLECNDNRLVIELEGNIVKGCFELVCIQQPQWQLKLSRGTD